MNQDDKINHRNRKRDEEARTDRKDWKNERPHEMDPTESVTIPKMADEANTSVNAQLLAMMKAM